MYYYRFAGFVRQMCFVVLCLFLALIVGAVYVQPRVNAASALLNESITIKAAEINLDSVEMRRMVDELKEAGAISGRMNFVRDSDVWIDTSLELRNGKIVATAGSIFFSDDPDPKKAARIAFNRFIAVLKEYYGNK